jgi:two-component system response regulator DesR
VTPATGARLTHRQRESLRLAAEGLGDREIAHRLGVMPGTVHNHIYAACRRLGVGSRVDAWRALGWLRPD